MKKENTLSTWCDIILKKPKMCHAHPPQEIYDVLQSAEAKGIEILQSVDEWWKRETRLNETRWGKMK